MSSMPRLVLDEVPDKRSQIRVSQMRERPSAGRQLVEHQNHVPPDREPRIEREYATIALGVNVAASTLGGWAAHKKTSSRLRSAAASTVQLGSRSALQCTDSVQLQVSFGARVAHCVSPPLAAAKQRTHAYIKLQAQGQRYTASRIFALLRTCGCPSAPRCAAEAGGKRAAIGRLQGRHHQRPQRRLAVDPRQRLEPLRQIRWVQPTERRDRGGRHQRLVRRQALGEQLVSALGQWLERATVAKLGQRSNCRLAHGSALLEVSEELAYRRQEGLRTPLPERAQRRGAHQV